MTPIRLSKRIWNLQYNLEEESGKWNNKEMNVIDDGFWQVRPRGHIIKTGKGRLLGAVMLQSELISQS